MTRQLTLGFALVVCLSVSVGGGEGPAPGPPPGPASPVPAGAAEVQVPFKVGEVLGYDVSWSSYLTAGTATLTVREKKPSFNSVAYYIVAEGRPTSLLSTLYSLYYKADTLLDVYTLLPQRGSVYSEEGRRRRMKVTLFDHPGRSANYEVRTATVVKTQVVLAPYTQDVLSAVYVLRAVPLKPGDRLPMPVSDNGAMYKVQITVGGRETLKTVLGNVPALRIAPVVTDGKGQQVGRGLVLWLSDDARRLPLRMQAELAVGSFVFTLARLR